MTNPFESAYEALVQREVADRSRNMDKQSEATRQQQHARAVAEPYLLEVGPAVVRRLTELRVEPIRRSLSSHTGSTKQPYWPLGATFNGPGGRISSMHGNMLCINSDGYFVKDPSLPGREGFEDLLDAVYIIKQGASYSDVSRESPVCVEDGTDRVCVAEHGYDSADVNEFAGYVASQVRLLHQASLQGPL